MATNFEEVLAAGLTKELTPILPDKTTRDAAVKRLLAVVSEKVEVPVCAPTKLTFWDKVWVGTKHFIYGFLLSGVPAIAISKDPLYLLIAGVIGGGLEAWRKVHKETKLENDSDWADVLDKLLNIFVELIRLWREKKSSKK
jgi:hypothetical protein